MAGKRIVVRLGSAWPCCPTCRNLKIEYQDEAGFDELAGVACPQCGWKGTCRELAGAPAPESWNSHIELTRAKAIVGAIMAVGDDLNALHALVDRLPDHDDRRAFRRHLGRAMATLNADVLMPLIVDHPDLDPDK